MASLTHSIRRTSAEDYLTAPPAPLLADEAYRESSDDDWKFSAVKVDRAASSISSSLPPASPRSSASIKYQLQVLIDDGLALSSRLVREKSADPEPLKRLSDLVDAADAKVTEFLNAAKEDAKAEDASLHLESQTPYAHLVHELRAPLQNLIGLLSLGFEKNPAQFLARLQSNFADLHRLMGDIPNNTGESAELAVHAAPFTLDHLLESVDALTSAYAAARGIEVRFEAPPHKDRLIMGDPYRLRQVLKNLITNAVKFSPRGKPVVVAIEIVGEDLLFTVIDQGKGIKENDQKKLFKSFSQIEEKGCCGCFPWSFKKKTPSTGLGLSFCKRLVEKMNDPALKPVIGVKSQPYQKPGAEFWFSIPYVIAPAAAVPVPSPVPSPVLSTQKGFARDELRFLIADDSPTNITVLKGMLKINGSKITVVTADNGLKAVQKFQEQGPFDVVILDMHMPVMGGAEAAKRIQALAKGKLGIAIASGDSREDVEIALSCHRLGREVAILTKPVRRGQLIQTVNDLVARADAGLD